MFNFQVFFGWLAAISGFFAFACAIYSNADETKEEGNMRMKMLIGSLIVFLISIGFAYGGK